MTISEAKQDVVNRLTKACIPFWKVTAKTVSFEGLGYGKSIFVTVHSGLFPSGMDRKSLFADVPKPSDGGYVVEYNGNHPGQLPLPKGRGL